MLLNRTLETRVESSKKHSFERTVRLGQLAIRADQLGINDPLTHVYQYIEHGYKSLAGMREDVETDIAERLPNTPFVNSVDFRVSGSDFVSIKDNVSMRAMTGTNLEILALEAKLDSSLTDEYERARLEAEEIDKLSNWFHNSQINSVLIFESLPIGRQEYAVTRIYRKLDNHRITGHFVSLHSPSVELFDLLRTNLGVCTNSHNSALDLLADAYQIDNISDDFISDYVGIYDGILREITDKNHRHGLPSGKEINGIEKVRRQTKLTSIYIDAIKAITDNDGRVSTGLLDIINSISPDNNLSLDQSLTADSIRDVLGEVLAGIASVIDRADSKILLDIEGDKSGSDTNLSTMSYFSGQARSEGVTYQNTGCPTVGRQDSTDSTSGELAAIGSAFNLYNTLDNFGRPKIGVCRISNCPSRGELTWWHNRTLVGGCDICVGCHKILEKGKSPQNIYQKQRLDRIKPVRR